MTALKYRRRTLILVFGQPTHKVVALQWKDITIHDRAQAITLGKHPVILEHPLDELVVAVSQSVVNRQTAANAVTAWVFPGYRPGSHLAANHVRIRLKKLGFPSLSTRIGTWQTITQTTPPPFDFDIGTCAAIENSVEMTSKGAVRPRSSQPALIRQLALAHRYVIFTGPTRGSDAADVPEVHPRHSTQSDTAAYQ